MRKANPAGQTAPAYYADVYFTDSDDDDTNTPEGSRPDPNREKQRIPSNDELLYDPAADDRDIQWVTAKTKALALKDKRGRHVPARTSDAELSCPMCLMPVCYDCQRHERFGNQYRAMFVENCKVVKTCLLRYASDSAHQPKVVDLRPASEMTHETQTSSSEALPSPGSAGLTPSNGQLDSPDTYYPVECLECGTRIAVLDHDDVYHFFNVIAF